MNTLVQNVSCLMVMVPLLAGCAGAVGRQTTRQGKVDAAHTALTSNRGAQVEQASKHVFAAGVALETETNRTPAIQVASEFAELAQLTLGSPSVSEVTVLRNMVFGLLSTNAELQVAAHVTKQKLLGDISALQEKQKKLEKQLVEAEAKRDADYQIAAEKAGKYEWWVNKIKWIIGIVCGSLLLSILLPALSVAFPVLSPFASIFNAVFGGITRSIFRIAPRAMESAGVVAGSAYALSERTAADLVVAIDNLKKKKPDIYELHLAPELRDATDAQTSRVKIGELKLRMRTLTPEIQTMN
jgi:hypothetical protein